MKLYHASRKPSLKILKPFPHNAVDGESVVFATTDPLFALSMTHGSGEVLAACYSFDKKTGKKEFYLDEIAPDALSLLNNSCSLYIVENKNFKHDKRLKKEELISTKEVKIIEEIKVENVLEELKKCDVKIVPYNKVLQSLKERAPDPDNPFQKYKSNRFKKVKD